MPAQLVTFSAGVAVALGGDQTGGDVAQRDQLVGLVDEGSGGLVGFPGVAGPVVDAAGGGVVAQRVERRIVCRGVSGAQAGGEYRWCAGGEIVAAGGEALSAGDGRGDHGLELVGKLLGQVVAGGSADGQLGRAVQAAAQFHGAEHPVRVVDEVGVDGHLVFGVAVGVDDVDGFGVDPVECAEAGRHDRLAAPEDQ